MSKKPTTKTVAPPALVPAMSPFDVEMTPEAQRHLAATISQIVTDFLAKGLRRVGVPIGQANAVKKAFESARPTAPETNERGVSSVLSSMPPQFSGRRWHVEIAKVNGLLAELHFTTDNDPVVTPREGETFAEFCERSGASERRDVDMSSIWISGAWRVPAREALANQGTPS